MAALIGQHESGLFPAVCDQYKCGPISVAAWRAFSQRRAGNAERFLDHVMR